MLTLENLFDIKDYKSEKSFSFEENNDINFDFYNCQNKICNLLNNKEFLSIKDVQEDMLPNFKLKFEEEIETKNKSSFSSQANCLFNIVNYKKRGKISTGLKKIKHLSYDFDNLQRKIQVHYLTFIINLCNDALRTEFGNNIPYNFKQIDYQLKKIINLKYVNMLKLKTIKEILKMRISPKNKKFSRNNNSVVLDIVCNKSSFLNDFFDFKYLEFFDKFYFNEEKKTDRIIFQGKEIVFSSKTKPFFHLIKKYEAFKNLIIDSAKSIYFYGYNSLIGNNSFKIVKNENVEIEIKE